MNQARTIGTSDVATSGVVLVVAASEEIAKRIESHLRNAGHPMRAGWVADLEELEDILRRGAPDLVICSEYLAATPLREVVALCARHAADLPVLALGNKLAAEEAVAALTAGARDLVCDQNPLALRHLELVCLREYVNHHHLRELANVRTRLADFESRHLQLLAGTADAVVHIQEGIISHLNPAFAQLLGYAGDAGLIGEPLMDLVCPDHQSKVKDHLKLLNKGKIEGKPLECCLVGQDGSKVNVSAQLTRGTVDGENFIEMLIRAEAVQTAAPVAGDGPVSGRSAFFQALALPAGKGARGAMLLAVDGFAAMEDQLGFEDAESVLMQLGESLRSRLAPQDAVYRFSTGEYAVLVTRGNSAEIEKLAELLVKEIAAQVFVAHQHEATLTLSVTAYPLAGGEPPGQVVAELVREARKLSSKGGNLSAVLGPTAKVSAEEREEARKAGQIRKAIEENRLKLAYQSIASLEGDERQHFDVLVRMIDDSGRELHAAEFIRAAEKFGLMRSIDRWVLARALKVLAKRESGKDSSMLFVKLSEDTLKDADNFVAWMQEIVKTRPLRNEEICFEIQEMILQNHIRKAKTLTQALRDLGALVAVEHFGIGSNSVQLLEHIPASFLKFHMSFTNSFMDKDIQKKMTTLMEVAKQRSIKTIVSHVEDANVMARMWQMGVNYIQGYHVQEPEVVLLSADPMKN